jgi:hypothetical protein
MSPENLTVPGSKIKKKSAKRKKYRIVKFKKEKFLWTCGAGIVISVAGLLIIWNTMSASDGVAELGAYSPFQKLTFVFPESTKDTLIFILGNLLLFLGVIFIFQGLKIVVKYISGKLKN